MDDFFVGNINCNYSSILFLYETLKTFFLFSMKTSRAVAEIALTFYLNKILPNR